MFRSKSNTAVSVAGPACLVCLLCLVGCGESTTAEVIEQPADLPLVAVVNETVTPVSTANPATNDDKAVAADRNLARFSIEPKLGDLDAMVDRRVIRVLTVYGPGRYFLENGPKGVVQEYANKLQTVVNEAYKTGLLTVQVAVIPVARDQLFPALISGYGDIVIAGTTITEDRQTQIDFTIPVSKPLKEILVTGPSAPPIASLADLSGKTVYLRLSSSYAESVALLSNALVAEGKPGIRIEAIDEALEDEDLIEMVDAGLLPWAVVDSYKPQMWREVFTRTTVREDLVLREGGRLAWAMRPDSPKLAGFLNRFLKDNREGTLFGNIIRNRYVRDFDWAENAIGDEELSRYRSL